MLVNSRGRALHRPSRNLPAAQLKMAHSSTTAVAAFVQGKAASAADAGLFHMQQNAIRISAGRARAILKIRAV